MYVIASIFLNFIAEKFLVLFFICNTVKQAEHSYKDYFTYQRIIDYWGMCSDTKYS